MSTYSLTVSLGTSVGKAVRPWLLQSTVLLLHTHLSGQPEANQEPKEDTITMLLRSPVSRLMVAAPTKKCGISLLFYQRTPRSLCLTRIQCKHATLLIYHSMCRVGWGASSLPACPSQTAGDSRAVPPATDDPRTGPRSQLHCSSASNPISAQFSPAGHQEPGHTASSLLGWKLSSNDYWHLKVLWFACFKLQLYRTPAPPFPDISFHFRPYLEVS